MTSRGNWAPARPGVGLFVSAGTLAALATSCGGSVTGGGGRRGGYQGIDTSANQIGRLTTTGNGDRQTVFQYDALGRAVATGHGLEGNAHVFRATYGYPQGGGAVVGPGLVVVAE